MEIIFNISNHPVYNFIRKATLNDLTYNWKKNRIIFKLEVVNYTSENTVVNELTKSATFIADEVPTINPPTSDIDLIMSRILNHDDFLSILTDCVTYIDQTGKLDERLGIAVESNIE